MITNRYGVAAGGIGAEEGKCCRRWRRCWRWSRCGTDGPGWWRRRTGWTRRYAGGLPGGFVAAAESRELPLIVFGQEVPFVEITEAVHARIIDGQLDQLRASARLHEVFTDLAVAGAGPGEILRQAALLAGRPVILEDLSHRVLACEPAAADPAALLDGFEARSRAVALTGRTGYDEPSGWLVTMAGARGEDWGRVILACGGSPAPGDVV